MEHLEKKDNLEVSKKPDA